MSETLQQKETTAKTLANMESYIKTHDVQFVAEDAVFINMSTGEQTKGREAIGNMLHYIYHIAFDAKAEIKRKFITETKAVVEANFKGKHIGEFAGQQPTNKEVDVPLCITYDLKDGLITEGRIYMLTDVMVHQLQS
jgi:predicted ester cyclase